MRIMMLMYCAVALKLKLLIKNCYWQNKGYFVLEDIPECF